jgi:CheY-like chemotaxis protein
MDATQNRRVLVVDDDPMIRHVLQAMLEAEGYAVTTAENGAAGVEVLKTEGVEAPFQFMVLDMMMPQMTGLDVLETLRREETFNDLPIILLTAENKPTDILSGYTAGANYYMTKPFTREQLLHGIQLIFANED